MFFPFAGNKSVNIRYILSFYLFIIFFFLGTLGEVLPCLRLGRRVLASEIDTGVHKRGMEVLSQEIKIHLAAGVDLIALWEQGITMTLTVTTSASPRIVSNILILLGIKLTDAGFLAQKGKDFLRGLQVIICIML